MRFRVKKSDHCKAVHIAGNLGVNLFSITGVFGDDTFDVVIIRDVDLDDRTTTDAPHARNRYRTRSGNILVLLIYSPEIVRSVVACRKKQNGTENGECCFKYVIHSL